MMPFYIPTTTSPRKWPPHGGCGGLRSDWPREIVVEDARPLKHQVAWRDIPTPGQRLPNSLRAARSGRRTAVRAASSGVNTSNGAAAPSTGDAASGAGDGDGGGSGDDDSGDGDDRELHAAFFSSLSLSVAGWIQLAAPNSGSALPRSQAPCTTRGTP